MALFKAAGRQGRLGAWSVASVSNDKDEQVPFWEAERYRSRANPWEHLGG